MAQVKADAIRRAVDAVREKVAGEAGEQIAADGIGDDAADQRVGRCVEQLPAERVADVEALGQLRGQERRHRADRLTLEGLAEVLAERVEAGGDGIGEAQIVRRVVEEPVEAAADGLQRRGQRRTCRHAGEHVVADQCLADRRAEDRADLRTRDHRRIDRGGGRGAGARGGGRGAGDGD